MLRTKYPEKLYCHTCWKYLKEYFLIRVWVGEKVWRSSKEKNEIGAVIQRGNTALTQTAALATCMESLWPRTCFNFCTSDWKQPFSYVATKSILSRAYNIQTRRGKSMGWEKKHSKEDKKLKQTNIYKAGQLEVMVCDGRHNPAHQESQWLQHHWSTEITALNIF